MLRSVLGRQNCPALILVMVVFVCSFCVWAYYRPALLIIIFVLHVMCWSTKLAGIDSYDPCVDFRSSSDVVWFVQPSHSIVRHRIVSAIMDS